MNSRAGLMALFFFGSGCSGTEGDAGPQGPPGDATGSIAGTVKAADGSALEGASLTTDPSSVDGVSDEIGGFLLSDVPIGAYRVIAAKEGFDNAALDAVGVVSGGTTQVSLVMALAGPIPASIEGRVIDAAGVPVPGATVSASGQTSTTVTDAAGTFLLEGLTAGFVTVRAAPPVDSTRLLPGGTRRGLFVAAGAKILDVEIELSGRPGPDATYVGQAECVTCHPTYAAALNGAAHRRSITPGQTRMVNTAIWPTVGGTVNPSKTAQSPVDGVTSVPVYLCNTTLLGYSMKFGGTADCDSGDGALVPVQGTYGGEGDGGIGATPNLGKFKQRYLARLDDVPNAAAWTYTEGKEKDWLILPLQITQSGSGTPKFDTYKNTEWANRSRTFSRLCAGCHVQGLEVTLDASNFVTAYDFLDQNIGCEHCHGPASDHLVAVWTPDEALKKTTVVMPRLLTPEAERETCGQCHAADGGKSLVPNGVFGYAWNTDLHGAFVPGVFELDDFVKGLAVPMAQGGGFDAWPDGIHGKAHRQQMAMLSLGVHANNPYENLTCSDCHSVHTLRQGPPRAVREAAAGEYQLYDLHFDDNSLCLSCHAEYGPFSGLTKNDVAAMHEGFGRVAKLDGADLTFTANEIQVANASIAEAVSLHMEDEVSMGLAGYNPLNDAMPVGRCSSCHMPKTGKSGGWTTGLDGNGASALVGGDEGSHAFDIVWPWQSMVLKKSIGGADTDIMPNSCGGCHPASRLSGD